MNLDKERDNLLLEAMAAVEGMTGGQLQWFLSALRFGWSMLEAGESLETVIAKFEATEEGAAVC